MSETGSLDTNEGAMPLLKVVNRLNQTMERLNQIELENNNIHKTEHNPLTVSTDDNHFKDRNTTTEDTEVNNEDMHGAYKSEDEITAVISRPDNQSTLKCSAMFAPKGSGSQEDQNLQNLCMEEHDAALKECIEVDTGDKRLELRSPRGDFGDDFGSDTDNFRAGWTRALEQADIRDGCEEEADSENDISKINALTVITEEDMAEQPARFDAVDKYKSNSQVQPFIISRNSSDSEGVDPIESRRDRYNLSPDRTSIVLRNNRYQEYDERSKGKKSPKQKTSMYDAIFNCCGNKPLSPKVNELYLLEDESRDDEHY